MDVLAALFSPSESPEKRLLKPKRFNVDFQL